MPVYGRLSRLTSNPRPRLYEPECLPLFDPTKPMRWCQFGNHFTSDDAPDPKKLGCPEHRSVKWRSKYKEGHKGTVITERWCKGCDAFRPRGEFTIRPSKRVDITDECYGCRANQAPAVNPIKERLIRCTKCHIRYPVDDFVVYIGRSGQASHGEQCARCYTKRRSFQADPARDARIIQQVIEGGPQRLVAKDNGVSRHYLIRLMDAYKSAPA